MQIKILKGLAEYYEQWPDILIKNIKIIGNMVVVDTCYIIETEEWEKTIYPQHTFIFDIYNGNITFRTFDNESSIKIHFWTEKLFSQGGTWLRIYGNDLYI